MEQKQQDQEIDINYYSKYDGREVDKMVRSCTSFAETIYVDGRSSLQEILGDASAFPSDKLFTICRRPRFETGSEAQDLLVHAFRNKWRYVGISESPYPTNDVLILTDIYPANSKNFAGSITVKNFSNKLVRSYNVLRANCSKNEKDSSYTLEFLNK